LWEFPLVEEAEAVEGHKQVETGVEALGNGNSAERWRWAIFALVALPLMTLLTATANWWGNSESRAVINQLRAEMNQMRVEAAAQRRDLGEDLRRDLTRIEAVVEQMRAIVYRMDTTRLEPRSPSPERGR